MVEFQKATGTCAASGRLAGRLNPMSRNICMRLERLKRKVANGDCMSSGHYSVLNIRANNAKNNGSVD
jgi:hypothetical protein